jgi:hypothetical protein
MARRLGIILATMVLALLVMTDGAWACRCMNRLINRCGHRRACRCVCMQSNCCQPATAPGCCQPAGSDTQPVGGAEQPVGPSGNNPYQGAQQPVGPSGNNPYQGAGKPVLPWGNNPSGLIIPPDINAVPAGTNPNLLPNPSAETKPEKVPELKPEPKPGPVEIPAEPRVPLKPEIKPIEPVKPVEPATVPEPPKVPEKPPVLLVPQPTPPQPKAPEKPPKQKDNPFDSGSNDIKTLRMWTDASGKYQVEARFVSFQDGTVRLQKANGRYARIVYDLLCSADQKFVLNQEQSLLAKE